MKLKKNTHKVFIFAGIFILALSALLFLKQERVSNTTVQENNGSYAHQFNGFETTTVIETTYLSRYLNTYKPLIIQNDKEEILPSDKVIDIKNYIMNYIIQWPDQSISEAKIKVETGKAGIQSSFSEMPLDTRISLQLNNQTIANKTPVDWAGHLTLNISNASLRKNDKICILINEKTICHKVGTYIDGEGTE